MTVNDSETDTAAKLVEGQALSSSHNGRDDQVQLRMASANPLTLFPSPDIDAKYTLNIDDDPASDEVISVDFITDLMPNHGFRVLLDGKVLIEQVVNDLPATPPSAADIGLRLTSPTNFGNAFAHVKHAALPVF